MALSPGGCGELGVQMGEQGGAHVVGVDAVGAWGGCGGTTAGGCRGQYLCGQSVDERGELQGAELRVGGPEDALRDAAPDHVGHGRTPLPVVVGVQPPDGRRPRGLGPTS